LLEIRLITGEASHKPMSQRRVEEGTGRYDCEKRLTGKVGPLSYIENSLKGVC